MKKQFAYSTNEEFFSTTTTCDSIQEAQVVARKEHATCLPGTIIYVGECRVPTIEEFGIDAQSVIEYMQEQAYELVGEASDSFLSASTDEVHKLQFALNKTVVDWMANNCLTPDWFIVENIQQIVL